MHRTQRAVTMLTTAFLLLDIHFASLGFEKHTFNGT